MNDLFLILSDADICSFADDITLFVFYLNMKNLIRKLEKNRKIGLDIIT